VAAGFGSVAARHPCRYTAAELEPPAVAKAIASRSAVASSPSFAGALRFHSAPADGARHDAAAVAPGAAANTTQQPAASHSLRVPLLMRLASPLSEQLNKSVNSKVKEAAWSGEPLPRGRHKLPREAVRASQRERLLRAMAQLVGERGYDATTVPQVVAAARVSSNTFYGFFSDKTDCFIALCEQLGEELLEQVVQPPPPADDPRGALAALNRGLRAYVRWWPERPALARAYFVELPMAGPRAVEERERQLARFESILRFVAERARELYPDAPPLRDVDVLAAGILMRELVASHVRAGRVEQLGEIEGDLRYLLVKLLVGDEAARQAAAASRAELD
jgi:AcrR family transcriptional regulator